MAATRRALPAHGSQETLAGQSFASSVLVSVSSTSSTKAMRIGHGTGTRTTRLFMQTAFGCNPAACGVSQNGWKWWCKALCVGCSHVPIRLA
eukprot:5184883-Amphidinium_carterae.1